MRLTNALRGSTHSHYALAAVAHRHRSSVTAANATHPRSARMFTRFGQPMRTSGPPTASGRACRTLVPMNQTSVIQGTIEAQASTDPTAGSPAALIPARVAARGKPRMNSDPSAEWTLLRRDIWARGVVMGSVSMKAAPSGPMATRMRPRLHGHADPRERHGDCDNGCAHREEGYPHQHAVASQRVSLSIRHDGSNSGSRKCSNTMSPTATAVAPRE